MNDDNQKMADRLRAAELLGKSQADFIDRHEHSGTNGGPIRLADMTEEQRLERIKHLRAITGKGA